MKTQTTVILTSTGMCFIGTPVTISVVIKTKENKVYSLLFKHLKKKIKFLYRTIIIVLRLLYKKTKDTENVLGLHVDVYHFTRIIQYHLIPKTRTVPTPRTKEKRLLGTVGFLQCVKEGCHFLSKYDNEKKKLFRTNFRGCHYVEPSKTVKNEGT